MKIFTKDFFRITLFLILIAVVFSVIASADSHVTSSLDDNKMELGDGTVFSATDLFTSFKKFVNRKKSFANIIAFFSE